MSTSGSPARRTGPLRARDRHGRGLRGPLAPSGVPLARSRADRFDELVLEAVDRLADRWDEPLRDVEFAVEDVPVADPAPRGGDSSVRLGRTERSRPDAPARVVVYRRPIEARVVGRHELAELIAEVVVEQVAELLGLPPDEVDPEYGDPDDPPHEG